MESQPQNPEFRNNPKNFHPCITSGSATVLKMAWCNTMINISVNIRGQKYFNIALVLQDE